MLGKYFFVGPETVTLSFTTEILFLNVKEAVRVRTDKANFGLSRIALTFSVEDDYPIP